MDWWALMDARPLRVSSQARQAHRAGDVFLGQFPRHRLGVAQAGLQGGDVDVVVDVAVVGGKVALGHLQRHRAAAGIHFLHTLFHRLPPCSKALCPHPGQNAFFLEYNIFD